MEPTAEQLREALNAAEDELDRLAPIVAAARTWGAARRATVGKPAGSYEHERYADACAALDAALGDTEEHEPAPRMNTNEENQT